MVAWRFFSILYVLYIDGFGIFCLIGRDELLPCSVTGRECADAWPVTAAIFPDPP